MNICEFCGMYQKPSPSGACEFCGHIPHNPLVSKEGDSKTPIAG